MTYADGSVYTGAFAHDAPHGRGAMRYASGDSYDGEWAAGQAGPDREAAVELARQVYQRCQERRRH